MGCLISLISIILPIWLLKRLISGPKGTPEPPQHAAQGMLVFNFSKYCMGKTQAEIQRMAWLEKWNGCEVIPAPLGYEIKGCGAIVLPEWCDTIK